MKNNKALLDWYLLLRQLDQKVDIDDHYCELISKANHLLRFGVVQVNEWHVLIKESSYWLADAAEREQNRA